MISSRHSSRSATFPFAELAPPATELGVDELAYKREWRSRRPEIVLGRRTFEEVLAQIGRSLVEVIDDAILERLRAERVAEKAAVLSKVEPKVLAAVAELQRRGLRLGLVTNSFPEDVAVWRQSPLRAFFEVAVSPAAGRMKPDPAICLEACNRLQVMPQHALFIGDGSDDELAGARAAGLSAARALWFTSRLAHTTVRPGDLASSMSTTFWMLSPLPNGFYAVVLSRMRR